MTTGTDFVEKVFQAIRRHGMLIGGEIVLVGVSGGADSVALLHALLAIRPRLTLTLHVIHVNHGLRPEADSEAAFVEALGRLLDVRVTVERVHVRQAAGQSLEAQARAERYAAFRKWSTALGASRVALGHTADDQAETVLMRLLEGAGPRGLAGIPPVRGRYIRPLIETRRREIEVELRRAGRTWTEDRSNRDLKFLRNRIRHDLLPFLAAAYNPRITDALCRAGALARELVGDLERLAARELDRLTEVGDEGLVLSRAALRALPPGIAEEVLRQGLVRLGEIGSLRGWAHRGLRRFLEADSPAPMKLGPVRLEVSGDRVRLSRGQAQPFIEGLLPVPGSIVLPGAGIRLEAREFERPASYRPPADPWTAVFDRAGLPGVFTVRSRRRGDRFHPFGGPGTKRLKAFLIDLKIPRWRRERLPLLVANGEIAWVVGCRRGAIAPITAATRRVLEVTATPLAATREGSKMGA
ncbi:MAG: tRNA lysidine(34) synthetase TilS [Candidatus Rokubacteria bacterium]|nr:tRNA lysidine(34) synthetase TilS [Candidatus Rokubacteria bacterium]